MESNPELHLSSSVKDRLTKVWDEIGFSDTEKECRYNYIYTALVDALNKMEEKEKRIQNDLVRSIDETGSKLFHITQDLQVSVLEPEANLTYIQLEKYLKEQLNKFQKEADRRVKVVKSLQEEEKELCCRLSEDQTKLPDERIPSTGTIHYLQSIVNTLEGECEQRFKAFKRYRASILRHMEDLNLKPTTPFERKVASEVEELFSLSEVNMRELKELCAGFEMLVIKNKEKEKSLEEEIRLLWERLKVDDESREFFRSSLTDNTTENIPKLQHKLEELKEMRRQNLGHYINEMRRELDQWWEKCFISEDEKENFEPYFSDDYTEINLELHEQEVKKIKTFYTSNERIFKKVEEWKQCWQKAKELKEREKDPNRLFGNRAGALLLEQKERKRVEKKLNDLEQYLYLWEVENGVTQPLFLICGNTLSNYIDSQKAEFLAEKQREMENRQEARSRLLKIEARMGTRKSPLKRMNPSRVDTLRTSKYLKISDHVKTPGTGSVSSLGSTLSRNSSKSSLQRLKNSYGSRDFLRDQSIHSGVHDSHGAVGLSDSTVISSYDKFTEAIQSRVVGRENVRSSVLPNTAERKSPRFINSGSSSTPKKKPQALSVRSKPPRPMGNYNRQTFTPTNYRTEVKSKYMQKTPVTLPRRRSSRLENCGLTMRATPSPLGRSRCTPYNSSKLLAPLRNKLSFLM